MRTLGKLILWFVCGLLLLLTAGAIWQSWATRRDARLFPPPGRMADVGGHRLFIQCAGAGSPTVIFDAGLGDNHQIWSKVFPEVAKFTRTCAYDRAGMGWSEAGPLPRDSIRIANELHTLLMNSRERAPFLLVGHSIAGCHARVYAAEYHAELAGLVLVDPTPARVFVHPPPEVAPLLDAMRKMYSKVTTVAAALGDVGLIRALGAFHGELRNSGDLDPSTRNKLRYGPLPSEILAVRDEAAAVLLDAQEASNATPRDLPIVLLQAQKDSDLPPFFSLLLPKGYDAHAGWQALRRAALADQQTQVAASSRGSLVPAERSGHYVQIDEPELVVSTIRSLALAHN